MKRMKNAWVSALLMMVLLLGFSTKALAQSTVKYDLQVVASERLTLLDTFPEQYATEKINVALVAGYQLLTDDTADSLDWKAVDFVVASEGVQLPVASAFDSVYAFEAHEKSFVVWQNHREIKNSQKRARANNAYGAFVHYVRSQTQAPSRAGEYIMCGVAALVLCVLVVYFALLLKRKRAEKRMTSVQREMLHRKIADRRRRVVSHTYLWALLLVLYMPIFLILVYSFTESKVLGNWSGFSWKLYGNLFMGKGGEALNSAIINTLLIALIAALSATVLGTLAAIGIFNMRAKQRKVVTFLNSVPMINPDIITGISLFLLFVALHVSQGFATVCIAHVVFCTPYVVLSVLPRLSGMNPNTYEAAIDLGATPFQALRMVLVPELWPGMVSGFVLALTMSVDDFGVTFFTKGSGGLETLSTFIYSDARKGGLTPELRPLFSLILLVVLTVLIVINVRADKKAREKNK